MGDKIMNQEYDDCSCIAQEAAEARDVTITTVILPVPVRIKSDHTETAHIFKNVDEIANIRKHSQYLDEVFGIAEESEHPPEVILHEKNVNLAA
jgi:hypothetical protein